MRKIRLDLDRLSVETYAISSPETERGTVHGHWSQLGTCDAFVATCQVNGTCAWTCGSRCNDTGTCL
ncbi:MAG TPA: hypothetical protein VF771_13430 [Longimicrobiaceae bacterium]